MRLISLPAYAICLERKPASSDSIQSWKRVFPRLRIAKAVDSRDLDVSTDPRLHALARMHLRNPDYAGETLFALPSAGAAACALSHYALCKVAARSPRGIVVIEQDVVFDDQAVRALTSLTLPKNSDYVSLLYIQQHDVVRSPVPRFHRLVGPRCDGNQCYYISPKGARTTLRHAFPIAAQCDLMYGILAHNLGTKRFRAYVLCERLYPMWRVFQDNLGSTVQNFRVKKYLPQSNRFYFSIVLIMGSLLVYMLCTL